MFSHLDTYLYLPLIYEFIYFGLYKVSVHPQPFFTFLQSLLGFPSKKNKKQSLLVAFLKSIEKIDFSYMLILGAMCVTTDNSINSQQNIGLGGFGVLFSFNA